MIFQAPVASDLRSVFTGMRHVGDAILGDAILVTLVDASSSRLTVAACSGCSLGEVFVTTFSPHVLHLALFSRCLQAPLTYLSHFASACPEEFMS